MDPLDRSWLAAAIDGEGSIYLHQVHKKKWPDRNHMTASIRVVNTNRAFVEKAAMLIDGSITSNAPKKEGYKRIWEASVSRHLQVLKTLQEILPYLIIKRDRALMAIDFIEKRNWGEWGPQFRKNMSVASLKAWAQRSPEERHTIAMKVVETRRRNPSTRYYDPEMRKVVEEKMKEA